MILICSLVLSHLDYGNCCLFGRNVKSYNQNAMHSEPCCMGCLNEEQNFQLKCSTASTPLAPNQGSNGI